MSHTTVAQDSPLLLEGDPFAGTRYRALKRIASGDMGDLFLVEQIQLGKTFVAKVLHQHLCNDPQVLERSRREAQCLGALDHANIVAAFDFSSTASGRPFMVMEHLRGQTLSEELAQRGPLRPSEALELLWQLLSALAAAHSLGIVHRDITPSNIFICDQTPNGPRLLKVLDFGIVRILPHASPDLIDPAQTRTATGQVLGTPSYLSPEAAAGRNVDGRADLYAAALILYAMLTGRGPFDDIRRTTSLVAAQANQEPHPPSAFTDQPLSPELDAIVLKGLRKVPSERYQTAEEFLDAVEKHLAILHCPPGLRTTRVIGTPSLVSREDPIASTKEETRPTLSEELWPKKLLLAYSAASFVIVGLATTVFILVLERLQ